MQSTPKGREAVRAGDATPLQSEHSDPKVIRSSQAYDRDVSIGPLIKDLREVAGLSQSELADVLCDLSSRPTVTRETVSRWEIGKRKPAFWLQSGPRSISVHRKISAR